MKGVDKRGDSVAGDASGKVSPRAERRRGKARPLASVLKNLFDPALSRRINDAEALLIWEEVVGEQIAGVSRAVALENGRLTVEVTHPVWRVELAHLSEEIIGRLNERLGRRAVRRIRFV